MQSALRPYFTTGVAIVGASVIAVAPLSIPPAHDGLNIAAAVQSVSGDVQLTTLGGTFDALINASLAGVALSLGLDVTVDAEADVAANLALITGAVIEQITATFGEDPLAALMELVMLPVGVVTGLVSGVLDGLGDLDLGLGGLLTVPLELLAELAASFGIDLGGGVDGGLDLGGLLTLPLTLLTLPITLITGLLGDLGGEGGLGGLLTLPLDLLASLAAAFGIDIGGEAGGEIDLGLGGIVDVFASLFVDVETGEPGPLMDLIMAPITIGAELVGTGAELIVNGTAAFTAAISDVLGGFLTAGELVLTGISEGIEDGAVLATELVTQAVTLLSTALNGTAGLINGVIETGAGALAAVVDGFAEAVAEFQIVLEGEVGTDLNQGAELIALSAAAADELPQLNARSITLAPNADAAAAAAAAVLPETMPTQAKAPAVNATVEATDPGKARGEAVSETASGGKAGGGVEVESPATNGTVGSVDADVKPDTKADTKADVKGSATAGEGATAKKAPEKRGGSDTKQGKSNKR